MRRQAGEYFLAASSSAHDRQTLRDFIGIVKRIDTTNADLKLLEGKFERYRLDRSISGFSLMLQRGNSEEYRLDSDLERI